MSLTQQRRIYVSSWLGAKSTSWLVGQLVPGQKTGVCFHQNKYNQSSQWPCWGRCVYPGHSFSYSPCSVVMATLKGASVRQTTSTLWLKINWSTASKHHTGGGDAGRIATASQLLKKLCTKESTAPKHHPTDTEWPYEWSGEQPTAARRHHRSTAGPRALPDRVHDWGERRCRAARALRYGGRAAALTRPTAPRPGRPPSSDDVP